MKTLPALLLFATFSASAAPNLIAERSEVPIPKAMQADFLANMRDHLFAISEIQADLAKGDFKSAGETASNRLGLNASSSASCRPGEMKGFAKYMPKQMHKAGFAMHSAADDFAEEMKKPAPDYRNALQSLAKITSACVACHAHFRLAGR